MSITVLGIDVGTSGSRALLIGEDGGIVASATAEHAPFVSKQAAWAEQDPQDWWGACQKAVRSVLGASGISPKQIACVGLSGQMHGTVVLDGEGAVLRPSIIWCDQRGEEDARWLEETVGAAHLLNLTSNPALTNFCVL
jgi:xylulokinase